MTLYAVKVSVTGMTCHHCVNAVTQGLDQLPGASSVEVDLDKRQATLTIDDSLSSVATIQTLVSQTIEDLGYDAGTPVVLLQDGSIAATFHVSGMTCASCVQAITSALSPVAQTDIAVSLATGTVQFQVKAGLDRAMLVGLVDDLGYTVEKATFSDEPNDDDDTEQSASLSILGMTCSHCVRAVTAGLQALPGVVAVDVSLDQHSATVVFEKGKVTTQLLVDTIQDLGYDVPDRPHLSGSSLVAMDTLATTVVGDDDDDEKAVPWSKVVMRVGGLTCESCVANLTEGFYSLPNVQADSVHVDLSTDMAMLICKDPKVEMVRDLVTSRGYEVDNIQIIHNLKQPAAVWNKDGQSMRSNSLVSLGAVSVMSTLAISKKVSLNVSGMTCSSCVGTLEKGLRKLPSVDPNSVKVNLLVGSATFNVRGDVLSTVDISEAVDQMGYTASNISMVAAATPDHDGQAYQVSFIISGMYCGSCVDKVRGVLAAMPGVKKSSISVDLDSGCTKFNMASDVVTRQRIYKEIQQLGFAADSIDIKKIAGKSDAGPTTTENGLTTTRLTVTGMTCSSCVANIERAMLKLPGVKSCQVNLLAKSAVILHEPTIVGARALANMIEQIGYKAELSAVQATELSDQRVAMRATMQKEIHVLRFRFLWSLVFAAPTVLISMIFLMAVPATNSVHQAFVVEITGGLTIGDLLLFLLATPVQFWLGLPFYKKAWRSLYYTHSANMETLVALGTTVAYLASLGSVIAAMIRAHQPTMVMEQSMSMNYFETSVLLITFIHLGKWLEALAKGKTAETITKLMDLQPEQAVLVQVKHDGDKEVLREETIDSKDIQGKERMGEGTICLND